MTEKLISFNGIHYQSRERTLLDIGQFSILEGDFLGIMGPNGAGKSTFLKIAAFLESPSGGSISYRDELIETGSAPLELRRKFSIALQQPLLLDTTVFQNIAVGLKLRGYSKRMIHEKVSQWMDRFEIAHLAKKNARFLSGGEAQRVSLARAMIIEPELLFLDEPFSALDFPTKVKLMEDFKGIFETSGSTAVFVSHDLMEVRFLTNKLAIIMDGKIVQHGQTEDVLLHPEDTAAPFLEVWKKFLHN